MEIGSNSQSPSSVIREMVQRFNAAVGQTVFGQEYITQLFTGAFLIGGHVLLEGPPGIAKTLLAKTFAQIVGLDFKRIQFTPDLMPSDVTGVNIFDQRSNTFRFSPGPILSDIVLADEINRTPPKTQAALLEAMQERCVTIDGEQHHLSPLFFVIATQNPIEHEGTFPLPEAQLDRFLFKLEMSYPEPEVETRMISHYCANDLDEQNLQAETQPQALVAKQDLLTARQQLRRITLSSSISDYILKLIRATRHHPQLVLGASPRAGLHLALAAKLNAAIDGRDYVIPDDVAEVIHPVLIHRLVFKPEMYEAARNPGALVDEVVNRVPVPDKVV